LLSELFDIIAKTQKELIKELIHACKTPNIASARFR